jgi:exopolyphosphatase/guanosine-5'-triphosphate,3'-diphosphate pyrophosphatase
MYTKLKFSNADEQAITSGKFAVVDLGSNSLRLVIFADVENYPHQFISERYRAKLAEGKTSSEDFVLSEEKIDELFKTLKWFDWICKQQEVNNTVVVATSALREAKNGSQIVKRAQEELGIKINIIDGQTEAKLSAIGALNSIKDADGLVLDLGGGSLEIYCTNTKQQVSLPLGILSLKAITNDDPDEAVELLKQELSKIDWIKNSKGLDIIANGGGMRSIAVLNMKKIGYTIQVPQGYEIEKAKAVNFIDELFDVDRIAPYFTGYDEKFKTAIPYRAALLKALFEINESFKILKFSNFGLREGVLFSQIESQDYNLAEKYAKNMSAEKGFGLEYALSSYSFVSEAFNNVDHDLLYLTSLLKDISWRVHKQYRADSLFDEILHLDFVGVDHHLRAKLAVACYFTQESELTPRHIAIIKKILSKKDILDCRLVGQAYKLTELINPARNGDFSDSSLFFKNGLLKLKTTPAIEEIISIGVQKRLKELNTIINELNDL